MKKIKKCLSGVLLLAMLFSVFSVGPIVPKVLAAPGDNLLKNPDFSEGVTPWKLRSGTDALGDTMPANRIVTSKGVNGSKAMRLHNDLGNVYLSYPMSELKEALKANTTYEISYRAWSASTFASSGMLFENGASFGVNGVTSSGTFAMYSASCAGWVTMTCIFTTPGTPPSANILFSFSGGGDYDRFIDSVSLREISKTETVSLGIRSSVEELVVEDMTTIELINTMTAVSWDDSVRNTPLTGKTVTWSSSAPGVATVANGVVTAVAVGTATITATIAGSAGNADIKLTSEVKVVGGAVSDLIEYENISLTVGSDETQRGLTWRSNAAGGVAQIALKSAMTGVGFPGENQEFPAVKTASSVSGCSTYKSTITGLSPSARYVYRVGSEAEGWSDIYDFTTGANGAFNFLYAGDPQIGSSDIIRDSAHWDATITKAAEAFPSSSFILSGGDNVESPSDSDKMIQQYNGFFAPGVLRSLPIATARGNHETGGSAGSRNKNLFDQHFNLPNKQTIRQYDADYHEYNYWFTYNNVLFMVLDFNNNNRITFQEEYKDDFTGIHKPFMQDAIAQNPDAKWKVVLTHQSLLPMASDASRSEINFIKENMLPIYSELEIDVVLMAHEHVYMRSYMMDGLTPIIPEGGGVPSSVTNPQARQVLYLAANSASGSKNNALAASKPSYVAVANQGATGSKKTSDITNVEVTDTSFKMTTYSAFEFEWAGNVQRDNWAVIDQFEIKRTTAGDDVPVTGVSIDEEELALNAGGKKQLSATIAPADATNKNVTWSSSNSSVVTVANGLITAVGAGTATITVTTKDGNFTAECKVTVSAASIYDPDVPAPGTGIVKGYLNDENGSPLSGVTLRLGSGSVEVVTDSDGYFEFRDVVPGKHTLYRVLEDRTEVFSGDPFDVKIGDVVILAAVYNTQTGEATVTVVNANSDTVPKTGDTVPYITMLTVLASLAAGMITKKRKKKTTVQLF